MVVEVKGCYRVIARVIEDRVLEEFWDGNSRRQLKFVDLKSWQYAAKPGLGMDLAALGRRKYNLHQVSLPVNGTGRELPAIK